MAVRFPFLFEPRYQRVARFFGVTPDRTAIELEGGTLRAWFGPWHTTVDLADITSVTLTGPYSVLKTIGPPRLAVTDRGLTFASNSRAGVCLELGTPTTGIDRFGLIKHPNPTLTPADCAGLAAALERRRRRATAAGR